MAREACEETQSQSGSFGLDSVVQADGDAGGEDGKNRRLRQIFFFQRKMKMMTGDTIAVLHPSNTLVCTPNTDGLEQNYEIWEKRNNSKISNGEYLLAGIPNIMFPSCSTQLLSPTSGTHSNYTNSANMLTKLHLLIGLAWDYFSAPSPESLRSNWSQSRRRGEGERERDRGKKKKPSTQLRVGQRFQLGAY